MQGRGARVRVHQDGLTEFPDPLFDTVGHSRVSYVLLHELIHTTCTNPERVQNVRSDMPTGRSEYDTTQLGHVSPVPIL